MGLGVWVSVARPIECRLAMNSPHAMPTDSLT